MGLKRKLFGSRKRKAATAAGVAIGAPLVVSAAASVLVASGAVSPEKAEQLAPLLQLGALLLGL